MHRAVDLDRLEELIGDAPGPLVLVFDADNTLVPQNVSVAAFRKGVTEAIERFAQVPTVDRVVVASNGPERGVPSTLHRANKPWTSRARLGLSGQDDVWIVGDQVLTDGLLAWRLGATFVHLVHDASGEDLRQATLRRAGRRLTRLFFVDASVDRGPGDGGGVP